MIIENMIQGSDEWKKARIGLPSASNFDKIVTMKGEPSKQSLKYMYQLAAERITGVREESYQNGAMQRGIELEDEARRMYSLTSGNEVEQVGICYPDEKKLYGCSPDGLIGDVGLVEIKCPTAAVHVSYLLDGGLPADYFQQVMGQLLITGREWCDFFSFYPGLPHMLVRVGIESSLKTAFTRELEAFVKSLETVVNKIREIK